MNAEDYKDFCEGGRYGGAVVMLQLKDARTFTGMLDERKDLAPASRVVDVREQILRQAEAQGVALSEEEFATLPPVGTLQSTVVPPVPLLLGTLEARGNLLVLRYDGFGPHKSEMVLTILPDDIKHITVASSTRIVT
jgi:hypothetical protein